jgi:hypothetical protein
MIYVKEVKKQFSLQDLLALDPLVQGYLRFFEQLDWSQVKERDEKRAWPGRQRPHPQQAYVKALLVKLIEGLTHMTDLRTYLLKHPLLVLALGFVPVVDEQSAYGFVVEATVPSARWLRSKLQWLPNEQLQQLLKRTVQTLSHLVPDLGQSIAIDCKHIYAWVRENNHKTMVRERYQAHKQPKGDSDCRLGVKRRNNRDEEESSLSSEALWGYASGAICSYDERCGHVAIAETTKPFNHADIEFFPMLYRQLRKHLPFHPQVLTADAAFDAWYVYEAFARRGGTAAIALNPGRFAEPKQGENGLPLCPIGLEMPKYGKVYFDRTRRHTVQRHRCPLLVPTRTGQSCSHEQFAKGCGCEKRLNAQPGGQMRLTLDRQSDAFKAIYRQRVMVERLFALATALGIERPKVRNIASVRNLNTLTYIILNVRALLRALAFPPQTAPAHLC